MNRRGSDKAIFRPVGRGILAPGDLDLVSAAENRCISKPVAHNRSAYGTPRLAEEETTGVALPGGWTLILLADRLIFLFRARLTKSHKPGVSRLTNQRKRAKRVTGTNPWLRWMALMTRAATRSGDVYIHAGAGRMDLPFLPSTMA